MSTEPTNTAETPKVETPVVPEGAILAIDSSIADPPPKLDPPAEPEHKHGPRMTPEKMMGLLKKMVDTEQMTPEQARQMRKQFGISQAYFTGVKISKEDKKKKKAIADASRKANRYNGSTKGAKRSHGRGD